MPDQLPSGNHHIDPDQIDSRTGFATALTLLRERAGLTVRQVARSAGMQGSTVGGYFSGRHLPPATPANVLPDLLRACGIADPSAVEAWRRALLRVRRSPGPRPAGAPVPYRGLLAFQPEDAGWFHGREELTQLLVTRLAERYARAAGPLVVVGASGSGKSSLLRAGLVPALRTGAPLGPGSGGWPLVLLTPGADPVRRLRAELAAVDDQAGGPTVVVDQFEEAFGAADPAAAPAFVAELDRLARGVGRPAPVPVVLAVRADFYGHALAQPPLASALADGQVVVGPMTEEQLRSAIVEPARKARAEVEDGLVEVLLRDLAPQPAAGTAATAGTPATANPAGALPLLSHALLVTWERGQGRRLSLAAYRDSGGLRGAVAQTAERVHSGLTATEQELARRLFLRLVRVSPDGADTARRVGRAELTAGRDRAESASLRAVLERFVAARLLTTDGVPAADHAAAADRPPAADAATVQLSHEALLSAWPRLRGWIDSDRAGLVTGQQLAEAAQAWDREGRDPATLYRGSRLAAARDWAAGHAGGEPLVEEFVAASARRERRGVRRLQQTVAALAGLLLVAVTAGVVAVQERRNALAQERLATAERDQALSRLVAGRGERIRDEDVSLAAQLSLAAYQIWPTPEAHAALLDSSAAHTATRLLGSTGVMQSVALSPDGRTLAAGTADHTVLLWDLSDPDRPVRRGHPLTGPVDVVYAVAFSPDGRTLAAGSGDATVRLWDVTDPARPEPLGDPLPGPEQLVYTVAFGPDGRTLAAGSADQQVHRWDVADPRDPTPLPPLSGADGYVQSVAYSPSGDLLAAGTAGATVRLWDVRDAADPVPLGDPLTAPERTVFSVAFSPDEATLAAGSQDGSAYLWDITDPRRPEPVGAPLAGASGWVQAVGFSPDGATLAAGSSGQAWLWDWRAGRVTAYLPHPGPVTSLTYGDGGERLVTAAADGTARIWRLPGPVLRGDGVPVNNLRYSPDGEVLAVASGETRLWSVSGRAPLGPPLTNPTGFSGAIAFTRPAGGLIVSDRAGDLRTWDVTDPGRPAPLGPPVDAHSLLIEQVALSPDGATLATGGDDNLVRLWDVSGPGRPVRRSELAAFDKFVYSVQFSPGGDLLAAASVDHTVRLWDVTDPGRPVALAGPLTSSDHYALSVAFHPDGGILAVGSADKNIYLWDITDPRRPARLEPPLIGPENYVYALAYSPDGRTLAAANTDGTVWLWDTSDPRRASVLATLTAASGALYTVRFHPDRPLLAAGGADSAVWLWTTDAGEVAGWICRSTGDPLTPQEWRKYVPDLPFQRPCRT